MIPLVVIGGGESAKQYFPQLWDDIKEHKIDTISINKIFKAMPYHPTIQLWIDEKIFRDNRDKLFALRDNGAALYTQNLKIYKNYPGKINTFITHKGPLKRDNRIFVGQRCLSGIAALSLALKFNYLPIFLFGYDFYPQNIRQKDVYQDSNGNVAGHIADFNYFNDCAKSIFLVGNDSKIDNFQKISYKQFVGRIKNGRYCS